MPKHPTNPNAKSSSSRSISSSITSFFSRDNSSARLATVPSTETKDSIPNTPEEQIERPNNLTSVFSKRFLCPISHQLMVDPVVVAEDGHTYERSAIVTWLLDHTTSPMVPSQTVDPARLIPNRTLWEAIEALVKSGEIDDEMKKEWFEKKNELDMEKVSALFRTGDQLGAAKLELRLAKQGNPDAQAMVAQYYVLGQYGFEKDLNKAFDFATRAAEGGDMDGQVRLGELYRNGMGMAEADWVVAAKWFNKAADQGCGFSMFHLGDIYQKGGFGLEQDLVLAFGWLKKLAGHTAFCEVFEGRAEYMLGECYHLGKGVPKDLEAAQSWYKKSAYNYDFAQAQYVLGRMMLKGEGGPQSYAQGAYLIGEAAENGDAIAKDTLTEMVASATFASDRSNV